jgi:hypothetical protein
MQRIQFDFLLGLQRIWYNKASNMSTSEKDNLNKRRDKDFERLSAYASALEKKYQQPTAQDNDFEQVLSSQKPDLFMAEDDFDFEDKSDELPNSNFGPGFYEKEENAAEEEEDLQEISSAFFKFWAFLKQRKYLLLLIPVFFLVLFLITSERTHTGTIKTDAYSYSGQILNDVPYGKGEMTYSNGDTYTGRFEKGKFAGSGVFTSKDKKWSFAGHFKEGLAEGKGIMTTPDGVKHEANYKNGVPTK